MDGAKANCRYSTIGENMTLLWVRGRECGLEAVGVSLGESAFSADFGGSSNYLIEKIKDRAKARVPWEQQLVKGYSILRHREVPCNTMWIHCCRKGIRLIFRKLDVDTEWQHKWARRRQPFPLEEFSFLFNRLSPWNWIIQRKGPMSGRAAHLCAVRSGGDDPWKFEWVIYSHAKSYR